MNDLFGWLVLLLIAVFAAPIVCVVLVVKQSERLTALAAHNEALRAELLELAERLDRYRREAPGRPAQSERPRPSAEDARQDEEVPVPAAAMPASATPPGEAPDVLRLDFDIPGLEEAVAAEKSAAPPGEAPDVPCLDLDIPGLEEAAAGKKPVAPPGEAPDAPRLDLDIPGLEEEASAAKKPAAPPAPLSPEALPAYASAPRPGDRGRAAASGASYDPAAKVPAKAVEPAEPGFLEHVFVLGKNWLLGGNTLLRVGVLLLFTGLAFLLRYASERFALPVEYRYIGVALSALTLLALGWRLRLKKPAYGLTLQGAGIAVLYLTTFAAMRLHPLLSPGAAMTLLVLVTLCSAILAVAQDALVLAMVAVLGGFAAPILTSTGGGNHVTLFSYFALLNAGIMLIAWFKAWRVLNLIGFAGTFGIGFAWGLESYTPERFDSTEPFLLLFFLMYVGIGLMFTRRKLLEAADAPAGGERKTWLRWSVEQTDYIDGTLMFGPPLLGFGLQCAMIEPIAPEYGTAFSALALGLFYTALAFFLRGRAMANRVGLLIEVYLALGVIFGTLAIPLALDARWTSAAWAVEGAGVYWIGTRQSRRLARAFALLLMAGSALFYCRDLSPGAETLLAGSPLGAAMLGAAFLFCHRLLRGVPRKRLTDWEAPGLTALPVLGLGFLYLIAPLCFAQDFTAIAWALAGLATFLAGLRLASNSFLFCAVGVQLLAGLLLIFDLRLGADTLLTGFTPGAAVLGACLLGCYLALRRSPAAESEAFQKEQPALAIFGLGFLYLTAPLCFAQDFTAIAWALAGLATLFAGLRLDSRRFIFCAIDVQLLAGLLLILDLRLGSATLLTGFALGAAVLGACMLGCYLMLRHHPAKEPMLAVLGLGFLYLTAPLCFAQDFTTIAWALAGLATLLAGLRLASKPFLFCALGVQLLGGVLFLFYLSPGAQGQVLASGGKGLVIAASIGLALIASAVLAQRDAQARKNRPLLTTLDVALLSGLTLLNLAALFVLDWMRASAVWAGSGLLILWLGLAFRQRLAFCFGFFLEAFAGAVYLYHWPVFGYAAGGPPPLAHSGFWTSAALALAALAGAWRLWRVGDRVQVHRPEQFTPWQLLSLSNLLLLWSLGWWVWSIVSETARVAARADAGVIVLLALSASAVPWMLLARREKWLNLARACLLPLAAAALVLLYGESSLLAWPAAWIWPLFFAAHFLILRRLADLLPKPLSACAHVLGCWLLIGVLSLTAHDLMIELADTRNAWRWLGWALAPALWLLLAASERRGRWPLTAFPRAYRLYASLPVAAGLMLWFWCANLVSNGASAPLPWLPLVNPLELGLLIALATVWRWSQRRLPELGLSAPALRRGLQVLAGLSILALLTLTVCRTAHHWGGVPFHSAGLSGSMAVQAGLSLVWTCYALALMIAGNRLGQRGAWIAGAALVGVVVVKLFFVELGDSGSLARIVSFIGVGVLLLIVGYFSPLPPRAAARKEGAS
ncbi:MAG: DUF2339 domain-containing protein [Candidatus Accumulibacter sp.]|nr:DUF2339 domain-containing protein [Accumulibacter sp.]